MSAPQAVVFDLGGVLFDWDAEYVYGELIPDAAQRRHFLAEVCNSAWRVQQDAGQSLADGTEELVRKHPQHEALIRQFYARWPQMLKGTLPEGMAIFEALRAADVPLYALTNWAAETWPYALQHHAFLQGFRRIVVSGIEGLVKPALALYELTHGRIAIDLPGIAREGVVFIDDSLVNVEAAERFGWVGVHHNHTDAERTASRLRALGLPL